MIEPANPESIPGASSSSAGTTSAVFSCLAVITRADESARLDDPL